MHIRSLICSKMFSYSCLMPAAHWPVRRPDWPRTLSKANRDKAKQHISDVTSGLIHICRMAAMHPFASVGTVKESYLLQLPVKDSRTVHAPYESPTADVGSETHSQQPSRQCRGPIGTSVQLMCIGHDDHLM